MNLPKIDMDLLPDLHAVSGVFGSLSDFATASVDDRMLVIMVYVYETMPPDTFIG